VERFAIQRYSLTLQALTGGRVEWCETRREQRASAVARLLGGQWRGEGSAIAAG
jgi:hypothetical protein